MQHQEFFIDKDTFLYIGKMGAGHVYNVAGSLLLLLVDESANQYIIKDYVTGEWLSSGNYHAELIDEPLSKITLEEFNEVFNGAKT